MKRVLLVCSVHRETGVATATDLLALLERIQPEVLFLEHSSTDLSAFLDGSCGTLESLAARRYRSLYQVELVPVDLPPPGPEFKQKVDYLFDRVEEASPEFWHLSMLNGEYTAAAGFAYLNSANSVTLQSAMQRTMRATVEEFGEPTLSELYALWTRTNDLREEAMLNGVEAFATQTPFTNGALLVGAAHLQSLFDKSQVRQREGASSVLWDVDWRLDGPHGDGGT